ncbi:MAG: ribonuclease H [Bacteroidota bacterium]|nr:ribonuclease H [Bacteroidota bacterium]
MVLIYTDGSCHTQLRIGGWAAIVFINGTKTVLKGKELDTTHNRMELLAVINAIKFVLEKDKTINQLHIVSDSQYVVGLTARQTRLSDKNFTTKKGNEIKNADLVKELLNFVNSLNIDFVKIKAHQQKTDVVNYNIDADKLSRKIVREAVNKINT